MRYYGKITAVAAAYPENRVTNYDLEKIMETSHEWIYSRTGISQRRIAVTETTTDLCGKVAQQLLVQSGVSAGDIDFIIVATMTPDYATPSVACGVQSLIGATNAWAFDLNAACSGFVYALEAADKLLRDGTYAKGLVIGGETLSKVVDWQDRGTAVLFGDGAGGVLLEGSSTPLIAGRKLQADGARGMALTACYRENTNPFYRGQQPHQPFLVMAGREIFDFATRDVVRNIENVLATAETDSAEIDLFLLHQANLRIIEKIAKKLKLPLEKFPHNLELYGNTSAASIPILLNQLVESGQIRLDGTQKIVLTGFGGGLTWGSLLVKL